MLTLIINFRSKVMKILLSRFGAFVLVGFHLACGQGPMQTENKEIGEHFTGRQLSNQEAVVKSNLIFSGELKDYGVISADAPGQTYHERANVRVLEVFWTAPSKSKDDPPVVAGQGIKMSFTVQATPSRITEAEAPLNVPLIFISEITKNKAGTAIKILRFHKASVEELVKIAVAK